MGVFFYFATAAALAAVVASLLLGLFYMSRGDDAARVKSQKMMQARVYLQGFAILMFVLAFLTMDK